MSGFDILAAILARRRRPVASVKPWTPSVAVGQCAGYVPAHRQGQQNSRQVYGTYSSFFMAFEPAVRPGQYGLNTRPMAASSGFA
jgi:hypothetical protein